MGYSVDTVKDLLRLGGNVIVTGGFSADSLKDFARLASANGGHLTVKASSYSVDTLKDVVRIAKSNVTIEV